MTCAHMVMMMMMMMHMKPWASAGGCETPLEETHAGSRLSISGGPDSQHDASNAVVGDSAIGSITPGDSTDPGTATTASQSSPGPSGFFGELKDKAKQIFTGAPAWALATVTMQPTACIEASVVIWSRHTRTCAGVLCKPMQASSMTQRSAQNGAANDHYQHLAGIAVSYLGPCEGLLASHGFVDDFRPWQ